MTVTARHPLLLSVATGFLLVAALCLLGNPVWQSDDDVAMSMVAHGYGLAAESSPVLFFSSPVWGFVVQHMPWIGGVPGYNIATLLVLALCAAGWTYCLLRAQVSWLLVGPLLGVIFSVAVLHPQFSVNAGMATLVGLMLLQLYLRDRRRGHLVAACLFGLTGFLIRDFSCVLVVLVAAPFFNLHQRATYRTLRAPLILLAGAAVLAFFVNSGMQQGSDWRFFREFNWARTPLTDYTLGARLQENPELLREHGYSVNDIALLSKWFFADRSLADPPRLRALGQESAPWLAFVPASFEASMANLTLPYLKPLWLVVAALLLFNPSRRRLVLSIGLVIGVALLLGAAGRPGMLRVYYPLVAMLVSLPLMQDGISPRSKWMAAVAVLGLLMQLYALAALFQVLHAPLALAHKDAQQLPTGPIVLWSDATPLQYRYPLLASDAGRYRTQFYPLGTFTYMPGTVSLQLEKHGKGLIGLLRRPEGVWMLTNDQYLELLRTYCREHFAVRMRVQTRAISEATSLKRVSCSGGLK